ncbi:transcriptional regulator CtsR [Clostridium tetanomorphum]|uniref:Transcriptional regulator CtsR n=1 Tax=Clostridium tetanomorphum TaxID=1553 RepID=A0A923J2K1_CLOTT|nr:CtsR family transcriptional regulator [Clostridium tetanomorphum]KAJ52205.1 transcriptional repressor CtsR [Clostridium tetanomorphum DSM 665]MBC2399984.1 CtsR family transcriptional regulator [Clostridium tetanomorphum]MBP1863804.1 transcriptional regulator CtsR [Clostridium tetanomorphum]NRS86380.1 transcriptional regulator CtsR [Clostridium tetanomorphum]NRZ95590.1 transcriptional regulator CtsR [Clostridium tetanomorphum]
MARLSDIIEEFIKEMLQNTEERQLQIQRNELANYFSCAPSQINYVLTTRFTTEKGYYVESKRGGGGCIIIKHVDFHHNKYLIDVLNNNIGDNITFHRAIQIIDNLLESNTINEIEANLIKVAINDRTLNLAGYNRNKVRAEILKNMLTVLLL